jgi:hypothetical protein
MSRRLGALFLATFVLAASALPAAAGLTVYNCHDHPDGQIIPPPYGLRIDFLLDNGRYTFSFDYADGSGVAGVTLTHDDVLGTIRIFGRAFGGKDIGGSWDPANRGWIDIDFTYNANVSVRDNCAGAAGDDVHVVAESALNAGTVSLDGWGGNQVFNFTDKADDSGCSFNFDNDWDSKGNATVANDPSIWSAAGWLKPADVNGSRDWVFIAVQSTVATEACSWGHIKAMYRQ